MELVEIIKAVSNFGLLIVIACMYLYYNPKMIEVIANNTSAMQDTKVRHDDMDKILQELKDDVKELQNNTDMKQFHDTLVRIENKIDKLGDRA
jgi:hypothetical protein